MLGSSRQVKDLVPISGWRAFSPSLLLSVVTIAIAFLTVVTIDLSGPYSPAIVIGAMITMILIILRQDELIAVLIIVVHIYVDWYLGLLVAAPIITLILLLIYFLLRSPQHPWGEPRLLWLWVLFLVLAIYPAIIGAFRPYDVAFYYPNIIAGALLSFWLGIVISKNTLSLRRFFKILAGLGTFLAIHTIIQTMTGKVIFGTTRFDQFIASTSYYALFVGSDIHRAGSFFVDPNFNGTFFATMLFLPLGLFLESPSFAGKLLYLVEALLMFPALLFTYSNGAWVGVFGGIVAMILIVGRIRDRILLCLLISALAIITVVFFQPQLNSQFQHLTGPNELSVRIGAWQTGINVINAYPLTGVGLGFGVYTLRAEPYRVPAQYEPLDHPHNSFIEIGAKAGLPVLAIFLALLCFALWQAFRNRALLDRRSRTLIAGGIASIVALCVNGWSINAWTLPPIAALGWIILGAISSQILAKSNRSEMPHNQENKLVKFS